MLLLSSLFCSCIIRYLRTLLFYRSIFFFFLCLGLLSLFKSKVFYIVGNGFIYFDLHSESELVKRGKFCVLGQYLFSLMAADLF